MSSISSCYHQLGQQAALSSSEELQQIVCKCSELKACGSFVHSAFLSGVISQLEHMSAIPLVHLTVSLFQEGLFGLQMLQQLLPAPQQAADMICKAASSQEVCLALLYRSNTCDRQAARHQTASSGAGALALQAVLQLLEAVQQYSFDAVAVAAADSSQAYLAAAVQSAADSMDCVDTGLQQYLETLLQQLQELAAQHAVLAMCLIKAAADCSVLCDTSTVASWVSRQLSQHLHSTVRPPATAALPTTPAPTPPTAAVVVPRVSWTCLAVEPLCWDYIMPAVLQCMPAQAVLTMVQDTLSTAAGSVTGLARLCDVVMALEACGHADAVLDMVSGNLSAALAAGDPRGALCPLLLVAHLAARAAWGKQQYLASLESVKAVCLDGNTATAAPAILRTFNLLLHTADVTVLEVHVEFLQQLRPHLTALQQDGAFKTEGVLHDVLAHRQQMHKQEQQARQGGRAIGRNAYAGHSHFLEQYMQWPADAAGHRLTPARVTQWRLIGAAAAESFCEAFVQQPPDTVHKARACLAYIQELQANRLCKAHHTDAFRMSCMAYGLDLSAQHSRADGQDAAAATAAAAAAADPLTALQGLLDRLTVVVAAGSRPGLSTLLSRITQHTNSLMSAHTAAAKQQQQQQQQQQQGCQPSRPAGAQQQVLKQQQQQHQHQQGHGQQHQWPPQPHQVGVQQHRCVQTPWPSQVQQATVQQQQGNQQQAQQQQGQQQGHAPPWPPRAHHTSLQQQQQQQGQQPSWPPQSHHGAAGPPLKKTRLAATTPAAAAAADAAEVDARPSHAILDMLLAAYAGASAAGPSASVTATSDGAEDGWDWRVEYLGVLQELPGLHGLLLQRLVGSLQGSMWAAEVSPQQALWHGSLLAWLSASKLQQLPCLAPPPDASVTTATAAAPLFKWHAGGHSLQFHSSNITSSSTRSSSREYGARGSEAGSSSIKGGADKLYAVPQQLQGLQLVQYLISCTSLATPHCRCCAASFWAGYVGCVKTSMNLWCAGPQGPFGSQATATTSPGVQIATTQLLTDNPAAATAAEQQQQLVAYVPPQLAVLLRQLVFMLTEDAQQPTKAPGSDLCEGGVRPEVTMSALQVCTRAVRVQAVKWVCQLYGV